MLWVSRLQTKIALSTMEAEYVALSSACKDLFSIMDLVQEIGKYFDLPVENKSRFHVRIHEDNVGALLLGQLEPRRMTPRSKHYALKYHWFRENLEPRGIVLTKIESKKQLSDIFTKSVGKLSVARPIPRGSEICGWIVCTGGWFVADVLPVRFGLV